MSFIDIDTRKKIIINWDILNHLKTKREFFNGEIIITEHIISKDLASLLIDEIKEKSLNNLKTRVSSNENKSHSHVFGNNLKEILKILNSRKFISFIEKEFNFRKGTIKEDPYMSGGGVHISQQGQFLLSHQDFNYHVITHHRRVINIILYLNQDWNYKDGGILNLEREYKNNFQIENVLPMNQQIIFRTDTNIWHGVNEILSDKKRISIALYYYHDVPFLNLILSIFKGRMTKFKSHKGLKNIIPYLQHKIQIVKNILFPKKSKKI